jgi:hypothetical protein
MTACASNSKPPLTSPVGMAITPTTVARGADALPSGTADMVRQVLAANADAVVARMQFTNRARVHLQQVGSPPPCETEEPEGAVVQSFSIYSCDGGYVRGGTAESSVRQILNQPLMLFAVFRPSHETEPAANRRGARFGAQADGTVVSAGESCGPVDFAVRGVTDFVVPPPTP